MVLMCLIENIDMCLLYKSYQIAHLVSQLINYFIKWMFTVQQENGTKFGTKNEISHFFISLTDFLLIWLNLNCVMQLKQFYNIAIKVSSRKKCYYFWWSTWLIMYISD